MISPAASWRRSSSAVLFAVVLVLSLLIDSAAAATKIKHGADPSIIKVGGLYYSAESADGGVVVRVASDFLGLGASNVQKKKVWSNPGIGDVWAPEITTDGGRTYIYFSAGVSKTHRMFVISAATPLGDYTREQKLNLPDDKWAIDGTMFTFEGKRWFVWSGWVGDDSDEQTLFICRMKSPTEPTGGRFIISQPREPWEQNDHPTINEGPEAIVDPNGQLHIAYSANGSWGSKYCIADLRLRKGGDPTYVWDWYKSNGCLFGSHKENMMQGWDTTLSIDGPGHHTFALADGDVNKSPKGSSRIPFVFHGVPKGTPYKWSNREWLTGSFVWWGKTTYHRKNVPGDNKNEGFSFKYFE